MYCSSRPESYFEVLPRRVQDDLITTNKGRQRASKSHLNFHIGGPHIQCISYAVYGDGITVNYGPLYLYQ